MIHRLAQRLGAGTFAVASALVVTSSTGEARGDGAAPCAAVTVVAHGDLDQQWRTALDGLRVRLAHLPSAQCRSVTLSATRSGNVVVLHAVATDGREAARTVSHPAWLFTVATGLLASVPVEAETSVPEASVALGPLQPFAPATTADLSDEHPSQGGHVAGRATSLSIGTSIGARSAWPTQVVMVDIAVRASLAFDAGSSDAWLLVAGARYGHGGSSRLPIDEDSYHEVAVGAGAGRRFVLSRVAVIDLAFVPTLAFVAMESDALVGGEVAGSERQLRLVAAGQLGYALSRRWRFTASLDTEVAPGSLVHGMRPDARLPPLPAWTTGARLGVATDLL